jgi:hypothetical protein
VPAKKSDDLKKILLEDPPRTDMAEVLMTRLQDSGVHSALADPAAHFLADLYQEALNFVRSLAPAVKNTGNATPALAGEIRQSAHFLGVRVEEGLSFLERVASFLDRKTEEDADATEAFEKNVGRMEKMGRLDDAGGIVQKLAGAEEPAITHGSWALANVYLSLVKVVGILELVRFERVNPATIANGLAEIHLDITHRLQPGLSGTPEGRTGLLEILNTSARTSA